MLSFGDEALLPDVDGFLDSGDRLSFLGLYRMFAAALRRALARGPGHPKKQRFTAPMLDFEKVRLDRLAASEEKERRMLQARIGVEMAARRTLVASMLSGDQSRQAHLRMQIRAIEQRISDLEQHLARLKGGLRQ